MKWNLIECMVYGLQQGGWRLVEQKTGDMLHPSLPRPEYKSAVLERPWTGFGPTRVVIVQDSSGGVEVSQVTDMSVD
jgi:hypothetical protein